MFVAHRRHAARRAHHHLAAVLVVACMLAPAMAQDPTPVDEMMRRIAAKYGTREREYEALQQAVAAAVDEALAQFTWTSGSGEGAPRPLAEHPHLAFVTRLAETARKRAGGRKNPPEVGALIEAYPWNSQLELTLGLEYGSDRPVPKNKDGFIILADTPDPVPGYPELAYNYYLYGLGEIAGWQTGVKSGKPSYKGRSASQRAKLEESLPAWEALCVYMSGTVPDVPLLAIPELTHRIHARLAERRTKEAGERTQMDKLLALLDSKWNGFTIAIPYAKDPVSFVAPVHFLFTDNKGFIYHFPQSQHMAAVGDLPFVAIQTYQQYSLDFRGERLAPSDLIDNAAKAVSARREFEVETGYLSRYKTLIDLIVRGVLSPEVHYPDYLTIYGYDQGHPPAARGFDAKFDVPQRQALLLWAAVGKDPERLADWLYDELLSVEGNAFPSKVSLPVAFLTLAREKETELLAAVVERITDVRSGGSPTVGDGFSAADFEREFSPYETYLSTGGQQGSNALANSFHVFHEQLAEVVRTAAYATVTKELED